MKEILKQIDSKIKIFLERVYSKKFESAIAKAVNREEQYKNDEYYHYLYIDMLTIGDFDGWTFDSSMNEDGISLNAHDSYDASQFISFKVLDMSEDELLTYLIEKEKEAIKEIEEDYSQIPQKVLRELKSFERIIDGKLWETEVSIWLASKKSHYKVTIKKVENECCLCGNKLEGYGNNPWPLIIPETADRKCCNECNMTKVIPARIALYEEK